MMKKSYLTLAIVLFIPSLSLAEKICLRTTLRAGKISQTVKTIASSAKCAKGYSQIVDTALLTGATGAQGIAGAQGPAGIQGPAGTQGATGAAGAAGTFTSILPSGQTLTGAFGTSTLSDGGEYYGTTQSFGVALSAVPTSHLLLMGSPATANCPGSAAAPSAAPGHLCVYEGYALKRQNPNIFTPVTGVGGASKFGFGYSFQSTAGLGFSASFGTWAVTAP